MSKKELIAKVAEKAGVTKKEAEAVIAATFEALTDAMVAGEKIQLVGFGTFEARERKARTGINPMTKEKVEIAATRVPAFKASKNLKDAVAK